MLHNDPKSKIQTEKVWILAEKVWILDFGLGNSWIPDFGFWGGPGHVELGNSVTVPWGQLYTVGEGNLVVETGGKGSKAYIFPSFLGF